MTFVEALKLAKERGIRFKRPKHTAWKHVKGEYAYNEGGSKYMGSLESQMATDWTVEVKAVQLDQMQFEHLWDNETKSWSGAVFPLNHHEAVLVSKLRNALIKRIFG